MLVLDLNRLVSDTLRLYTGVLQLGHLRVQQQLQSGLPGVRLDVEQMRQVIINLVDNALEALGGPMAPLRPNGQAPTIVVADRWGDSIVTGRAVPNAAELFARGLALAPELAARGDYLMLAESVPGGTTTALALLCGLGVDAWGRVSSSMPENAHPLKQQVVEQALAAAGLGGGRRTASALDVAAAIGRARAMRMALLAEPLTAQEAYDTGLVSHLATDAEFPELVDTIVRRLVRGAPLAQAATKKAVNAATLHQLEPALERERTGQTVLLRTDDAAEGMRAFGERRRPDFRGS